MARIICARTEFSGRPRQDKFYTVDEVRGQLPCVGEMLVRTPALKDGIQSPEPAQCVVTYVNRAHLWYIVEFRNGFRECYKMPETLR